MKELAVTRSIHGSELKRGVAARLASHHLASDQIDKPAQFRQWLALFFIERGRYIITLKGYVALAPQEQRQDTHFGEDQSAKERSTKTDLRRPVTEHEMEQAVSGKVAALLLDGRAEELYAQGCIDRPSRLDWKDKSVRVTVIKKLLDMLGVDTLRLDNLIAEVSMILLKAAGGAQLDVLRFEKVRADIRRILDIIKNTSANDFLCYGLSGLLNKHYHNSPYAALVDVGYAYPIERALRHAAEMKFGTIRLYPWEMNNVRVYQDRAVRIAAIKWAVWKTGKQEQAREIRYEELCQYNLEGLLMKYYHASAYEALLDAGLVTPADESYMRERRGVFMGNR